MSKLRIKHRAFYIAAIYTVVSFVWIFFSDHLLEDLVSPSSYTFIQYGIYKGFLFVFLTGVLIYFLTRNSLKKVSKLSENLDSTQQHYLDLLSNVPVGIYQLDSNGQLSYVNTFIVELLGLSKDELIEDGWTSYIDVADHDRVKNRINESIKQSKLYIEQYRIIQKDLGIRWVVDIGHPEINSEGQCVGYRGTLTDITDKIEAENEVIARDDMMNKLMQANPDSIALFDAEGNILKEYSATFSSLLGFEPESLIGKNILELTFPEDHKCKVGLFNELVKEPGKVIYEQCRFKGKNDETYWVDYSFTNMLDDPVIGAIVGHGRDISEHKQIELQLAENELKFRILIEASLNGVYLIQNGRFIYVNPELQNILGYTEEELYEMPSMMSVVHEDDRELVKTNLQQRVSGAVESMRYPFRCRHKEGHTLNVEAHGVRTIWKEQPAVIGSLLDFTEKIQSQKKLEEKEQQLKLFIKYSPAAIAMFDNDLRFLVVSQRWLTDYNIADRDITGLHHYEVFPEIPERWREIHQRCLKGEIVSCDEDNFVRPDGSTDWVRYEVRPWNTYSGEIGGIIIFSEVITERVMARQKEHDLQEKLNLAITSTNLGIWIWNLNTNKVFYSKEWKSQLGYSEDEIDDDYNEWKKRLHPDDQYRAEQCIQQYLEHPQTTFRQEFRLRHKNGTYRWIMAQGNLVYGESDEADQFLGTHYDITSLKTAERAVIKSKDRLDHVLDATPTVLYSLKVENNQTILEWLSNSVMRITGYSVEEALQAGWWEKHLHPDDKKRCLINASTLMTDKNKLVTKYRFQHKEGYSIYLLDQCRVIRDKKDNIIEILGSWSDVSEEHEQQQKMTLYTTAFMNTDEGVMVTGLNGEILFVNNAFTEITGYSEEELLGQNPRMLQSGRHDRFFYQIMWSQIKKNGRWSGEVWNRRKNGEVYPQWLRINVVDDDNGQPSHYIGITSDITYIKKNEAQLDHLAHYDALTDLPNRLLLNSRIKHAISQAARNNTMLAVMMLDLDDFKKINDSLGHDAGDELLKSVSQRWQHRLREEDTLARLGGDEFIVLLENLEGINEAAIVAQDLLSISSEPFKLSKGSEIYAETSIGISLYPHDADTADGLLRDADTAMFQSKHNGRNQFSYYTADLGKKVSERLQLETSLRQGIANNELVLHYQPKVNIRSGKIVSSEALVRWQRPDGLVPPGKFIPVAERSGLIVPIGEWVIKEVCKQLKIWKEDGNEPVQIAINIAAQQFRNKSLVAFILKTLNQSDIDPKLLEIEITESSLMDDPDDVIRVLNQLKDKGIKIALDDFGTGYSNISYLSRYPIDSLKIDASFVRNIETDPNALKLIKSVIKLAHTLNMQTIAEGVETLEQLNYLREYECDEIQGYYFSKPVPSEDFMQQVNEKKSLATIQASLFKSDPINIH